MNTLKHDHLLKASAILTKHRLPEKNIFGHNFNSTCNNKSIKYLKQMLISGKHFILK